jgi:hypothetical protein
MLLVNCCILSPELLSDRSMYIVQDLTPRLPHYVLRKTTVIVLVIRGRRVRIHHCEEFHFANEALHVLQGIAEPRHPR